MTRWCDHDWTMRVLVVEDEALIARALSEGLEADGYAVLIELACETDFVARGDDFKTFVNDVALHIAASKPEYLKREDVDEAAVAKEREILVAQVVEQGQRRFHVDAFSHRVHTVFPPLLGRYLYIHR